VAINHKTPSAGTSIPESNGPWYKEVPIEWDRQIVGRIGNGKKGERSLLFGRLLHTGITQATKRCGLKQSPNMSMIRKGGEGGKRDRAGCFWKKILEKHFGGSAQKKKAMSWGLRQEKRKNHRQGTDSEKETKADVGRGKHPPTTKSSESTP